jgi:diguanylate cyclase (GGDEF)-like protein
MAASHSRRPALAIPVRETPCPRAGNRGKGGVRLIAWGLAVFIALGAGQSAAPAYAADGDLLPRGRDIESALFGYPKRSLAELAVLAPRIEVAPEADRRYFRGLYAQAMVATNRTADALLLADRLQKEGEARREPATVAVALLIRSGVQQWAGDTKKANALAIEAQDQAKATDDLFVRHWAAMAAGITSRQRGETDDALARLEEARSLAEQAHSPYRRSLTLYQLSVLYRVLNQPEKALAESVAAFAQGSLAKSVFAMAKSKMAESAAYELLNKPKLELAALQEALAIARNAHSDASESLALVNLSDIYLRRKDFRAALDFSRRSLEIAGEFGDTSLMATSKANMGFAMLGLGRIDAGKRLADEALAEYERTGATADISGLLREYGQYLEAAGDNKGALVLFHRERKLNDELTLAGHDKAVLELQTRYESEKRQREIELLNRENRLNMAELENRRLQQSLWWLLAFASGVSFVIVALLYRKLKITNRLLGQKNDELRSQSSRDPLTALYNRRYFQDFIGETGNVTERRHTELDKPVQALLLIDIDHFKQINDRYGHATGDAVLVSIGRRLRETLRETDMIVRWGGEEFLVFVPVAPADRIEEIVLRTMAALSTEPIPHQGRSIRITASIGYTPLPLPPDGVQITWERAITLVDMALYMAKLHGRNRAYGIRRLVRSDDASLQALDHDLEAAWRAGIVDMQMLQGATIVDPPIAPVAGVTS